MASKTIVVFFCLLFCQMAKSSEIFTKSCINIYYDQPNEGYVLGKIYGIMAYNLLGHFPQFERHLRPIENYLEGEVNQCKINFYIGSYYDSKLSTTFLDDIVETKSKVVWLNYNLWHLQEYLGKDEFFSKYSLLFKGFLNYDSRPLSESSPVGFYRYFNYKGKKFTKYYRFDHERNEPVAAPELIDLDINLDELKIHSYAEHSLTQQQRPYILQKNNFWFIADNPFVFIHETDRYLIFSDILFDILEAKDQNEHNAHLFIENVHPVVDRETMLNMLDDIDSLGRPFSLSVISRFIDPFGAQNGYPLDRRLDKEHSFWPVIKKAKELNATFIMNGYTHRVESPLYAPYGISGAGYEFWDANNNSPVKHDGAGYVLPRVSDSFAIFDKLNINPSLWKVPLNAASCLDYLIFSYIFDWTIGRVRYAPFDLIQAPFHDQQLRYSYCPAKDKNCETLRKETLQGLMIGPYESYPSTAWVSQFFPYVIYEDYYGQSIIPENLGSINKVLESNKAYQNRGLAEMTQAAEALSVVRDSWASFYFHPQHRDNKFPHKFKNELYNFIHKIESFGFKFVYLQEWLSSHKFN